MSAALSVTELNNYLKAIIEGDLLLSNILVSGEVSNFKEYSLGGQWYFTLKDEQSQINCVVFQNFQQKIKQRPTDGDKILVKGRVTLFHKRGTYSLQVFWLEPVGLGALAQNFEKLKKQLEKEGLFKAEAKKELPAFPHRIAILAAPDGAAVHDVIKVSRNRNRFVELVVVPTIVQGKAAVESIVHNLALVQSLNFDLIILARGGGSLEDLSAFNEEAVARAIFASSVPVISAVGHETDFTIADFVADLRAPTPSAAAEMCVPAILPLQEQVALFQEKLKEALLRRVLDYRQDLDQLTLRITDLFKNRLAHCQYSWQLLNDQLEVLNPLAVLKRGYAVLQKETKIICSIKQLKADDIITAYLADGQATARVEEVAKK